MKYFNILALCFLLHSCSVPSNLNSSHNRNSPYASRYAEFLPDGEFNVRTTYYQMLSKTPDDKFKLRTFYPETKQLTTEITSNDSEFRRLNGPAKQWYDNGQIRSEGQYENNARDGMWTFYKSDDGQISRRGRYSSDMKMGKWEFFDSKGRLSEKVQYEYGRKNGPFERFDSLGNVTNSGEYRFDTIYQQNPVAPSNKVSEAVPYMSSCKTIKDKTARDLCSQERMLEALYSNLKYPREALEFEIQGEALVNFTINKEGKVEDIKVLSGLCNAIKAECLRVIKTLPLWEPGIQDGKPVDVYFNLPISFKILN